MIVLAQFLGVLAGTLSDPVTWVVMIAAIATAIVRWPWWTAMLAAGAGAVLVAVIVGRNSALIGVPFNAAQVWFGQLVAIGAWSQLAYWCTRACRRAPA
jgi:hypothetical protein